MPTYRYILYKKKPAFYNYQPKGLRVDIWVTLYTYIVDYKEVCNENFLKST